MPENEVNPEKEVQFLRTLLAAIAHDLKAPLQNLEGLITLILEEVKFEEGEIKETLRDTEKQIKTYSEFIQSLLKLAGKRNIQKITFDIEEVIEEVVLINKEFAAKKGVKICHVVEHKQVDADKDAIAFVLRNLIQNAIKFSKKGDAVTISVKPDRNLLRIIIKDSGAGMDEETLEKAMNIEKRGTYIKMETGTNGEPSTGLGLSLCKYFLDTPLYAESKKGMGSKFYFNLPLHVHE